MFTLFRHFAEYLSLYYTYILTDDGAQGEDIFKNMPNLYYVDLAYNDMGALPADLFASNPDMETLLLYGSGINGTLDFIKPLSNLVSFEVYDNPDLGGSIPVEVGNMISLQTFDVANCGLTGGIPVEFGQCLSLYELYLFGNKLTGGVPAAIGNIPDLEVFACELNDLSGAMPAAVCALTDDPLMSLSADCAPKFTCSCCDCCGPTCNAA